MIDAKALKRAIDPATFYRARLESVGKPGKDGWANGGLCPFHNDHKAGSFYINTTSGAFRCFSCGASGGDVIDFEMKAAGLPFGEVVKALAAEFGTDATASPEARGAHRERG